MNKTKLTQWINRIFVVLAALVLSAALVRALVHPAEKLEEENRYASHLADFSAATVSDGTFQASVGDTLSDQLPFSAAAKRAYNRLSARLALPVQEKLTDYTAYRTGWLYRDHIVYRCDDLAEMTDALSARAAQYRALAAAYPALDFSVFYVERDNDIDFVTGKKSGVYEYLASCMPEIASAKAPVDSYAEFDDYFYKTDHHWNAEGSYRGYTLLLPLLGIDTPLAQIECVETPYRFSGSKASEIGADGLLTDPLWVYRFALPAMTITCDGGTPLERYGASPDALAAGALSAVSYGAVYGWDSGELIFDTHRPEKESILVIGESYDNAILPLIASHFDRTCSIDLRHYERIFGRPFDFDAYVRENGIDRVLFIGCDIFFSSADFAIGGVD